MKRSWLKIIFSLLVAHCTLFAAFAQTAERIDDLIQTEVVSYDGAARFVLEAADLLEKENLDPAQTFTYAMEHKWLSKNAVPDVDARLDAVSLLIMRSFDVKGGLLYSLFKNPHYAYREMVYKDVIPGKTDPQMTVSGEMLLYMVNRILTRFDDAVEEPWTPLVIPEEPVHTHEELVEQEEEWAHEIEALAVEDTTVRVAEEGLTISINNVQFLADSSELPESVKEELREISEVLRHVPLRRLLITGHTALAGTEEDRLALSLQRAQTVKNYLVSLGTRNASEITTVGVGADYPIADNNTPEGMALNRRVEITILEHP